jgi:cysteine desulfurase
VGIICNEHQVLFHSDTVQSVGKVRIDLQAVHAILLWLVLISFMVLKELVLPYKKKKLITTSFHGGEQERAMQEQRLYIKLQEWPRPCQYPMII